MPYILLVLCCWPAAGADNILVLLLHIFTDLLVAYNSIYSTENNHLVCDFLEMDAIIFTKKYVGEMFLFLWRSRSSCHVPETYLPVIAAATLLRLLLTLVIVLCIGGTRYVLLRLLLVLLLLLCIADPLLNNTWYYYA